MKYARIICCSTSLLIICIFYYYCTYTQLQPILSDEEKTAAEWLYDVYPPYTTDKMSRDKWFHTVELVDLPGFPIDDSQLNHLKHIPNLSVLQISNTDSISLEGFRIIALLNNLKSISLYDKPVDDSVLDVLTESSQLESLKINASKLTSDGFAKLARLKHLRKLYLEQAIVLNDTDIAILESLPHLESVTITEAILVTPKSLDYFVKCPSLGLLEITGSPSLTVSMVNSFERLKRKSLSEGVSFQIVPPNEKTIYPEQDSALPPSNQ